MKRRRGDFIGSFAVFGYKRDPEDRHKLVVDDYAADAVRDIFRWKLAEVWILAVLLISVRELKRDRRGYRNERGEKPCRFSGLPRCNEC